MAIRHYVLFLVFVLNSLYSAAQTQGKTNQPAVAKVILVAGVIGPNGKPVFFKAVRAEARVSQPGTAEQLTVQGLDSNGVVISTVQSSSGNELRALSSSGPEKVIKTDSTALTATLADHPSIVSIQVLDKGKVLFTEPLSKSP
jgi:hypothetical protein